MNAIRAIFLIALLPTTWLIGHWSASRPPHPQALPRVVFAGCARVTNVRVAFLMTLTAVVGVLASRAGTIMVLWVALVLALGKWGHDGPGREDDPFFTMGLHLAAVRAALPSKANAKVGKGDKATYAGQHWGLTDFRVRVNEHGDRIATYYLPAGVVAADVIKALHLFVSALGRTLTLDEVEVTAHNNRPGALCVILKAERPQLTIRQPRPATGNWRDPILLGRDETTGLDVELATLYDVPGGLAGGQPGSGKSSLTQIVLGHVLADPATIFWGVDWKDDDDDYAGVKHRAHRWLEHSTLTDTIAKKKETGERYLAMLTDALEVMAEQKELKKRHGRGSLPLFFLLIEEASTLRNNLEKHLGVKSAERADALVEELLSLGRSYNVHVWQTAQKPSAKKMDTDVRSLIGISACGSMKTDQDAWMVLGDPFPAGMTDLEPGHMRLRMKGHPADGTKLYTDFYTPDQWAAVCAAMPSVQPDVEVEADETPQDAPACVQDTVPADLPERSAPEPEADELLTIVQQVLRDHGPVLTCTGILDATDALLNLTREQLGESLKARGVDTGKRTIPGYGRGYWVALNDVDMALAGVNQTA